MLTAREVADVLGAYDLGAPVEVLPAACGYVNETAIVRTWRGQYVVRRNHRRFAEPLLRYRHALTTWLRERGAPVPALAAAADGATLLVRDRRFYEVHAFLDGQPYDPACPRQLDGIGAALARFHEAARGFPAPSEPGAPRYSPWDVDALAARLIERDVMGELHEPLAWYGRRAAQLRAALPDDAYAGLPHLVIHGDVHCDNLRFAGDGVAALVDLDQASWDARVVDLADALVAFAVAPFGERGWGVFAGPLDPDRVARLLAAYGAVSPLTPPELAALPALVEVLWLRGELGRVVSTAEGAPEYHLSVLEQGRSLSAWMAGCGASLAQR